MFLSPTPRRVALAGLLVGVAGIGACTTVRRVQPAEFLRVNNPDVLWVTYTNNSVVGVAEAELAGDTLKGMRRDTREPIVIPLHEVRSVEAKVPDSRKTTIAAIGVVTGFVASVYVLWISKAGSAGAGDGVVCGFDPDGRPIPDC